MYMAYVNDYRAYGSDTQTMDRTSEEKHSKIKYGRNDEEPAEMINDTELYATLRRNRLQAMSTDTIRLGHTTGKGKDKTVGMATEWRLQGKRPRGKPGK